MANPSRGEVAFDFEDAVNPEHRRLVFKFSNAGKRAVEEQLGMERPEIVRKIDEGNIGDRLLAALLFGGTRKFHARQFPNPSYVDRYLDDLDDEDEDGSLQFDLAISLIAAYMRIPKSALEDPGDAPEEDASARGGEAGGEDEDPKDTKSRSARGKSSSGKGSEAA